MLERRYWEVLTTLAMTTLILLATQYVAATTATTYMVMQEQPVIFRVGWTYDIDTLNPITFETDGAGFIIYRIYDGLFGAKPDMTFAPRLVESWEVSDDRMTWTFHIRKDAKWHDGEPLTAEDVAFTFNLWSEVWAYSAMHFEETEATDDYTVVVHTDIPLSVDLMLYYLHTTVILPKHIWENVDPELFENYPNTVGNGPFKVVEWVEGQYITLEKFDDYYGEKPKVDRIIFKYFDSAEGMVRALKNHEIDFALNVPAHAVEDLKGIEGIKISVLPSMTRRDLGISCYEEGLGHPALRDKWVRLAMAYAIDRQAIVDMIYLGYAIPGDSVISPAFGDWYNPNLKGIEFNLEKAAQILEEHGYIDTDGDGIREDPEGNPLRFRLFMVWSEHPRIAEMLKSWFNQIGIDIVPEMMDEDTLSARIYADYDEDDIPDFDFDLFLWGWTGEPDPDMFLYCETTDSIEEWWSEVGWSNETYDELYEEQLVAASKDERKQIIWKMQEILYWENPYIFLCYLKIIDAYWSDWTGFVETPDGLITYAWRDSDMNVHLAAPPAPPPAPGPGVPMTMIAGGVVALVIVIGVAYAIVRRRGG